MNHEPECPMAAWLAAQPTHDPREPMCFCNIIRAAYQRGREDAAKAVEAVEQWEAFITESAKIERTFVMVDDNEGDAE